ncbi:hypothetical protein DICSQDRAFT_151446 [Dichomitus squalens LYAD-421 SS1]|uniref:uncharacterized protein n=1 Tax=Dichomitus squalens (strain LYAD-421) TaxID=732165 RepID=UPI0004413AC7|nr:uncharacterized protein DICSQDRAFT_151446 [Dichomitus squalens LYAD-421 SS1]EJF67090.1 hypothetical protein DICSQDRAFT_151446 [Dichomitus squalens LYAD-421 SS1]
MAAPTIPEEQLLELLLTLKRTTAAEAKAILNQQPQIAYALMTVMVNINAVKMEVVQEILAKYGALPGAPRAPQATAPPAIPSQPPSAIPPHMQAQIPPPRGATPTYPVHAAVPPGGYPPQSYPGGPPAPPAAPNRGYGTPPPNQVPGFGTAPPPVPHPPAAPAPAAPQLPDALTGLPDDQKALIMRVIAMTREEVYAMPPADRENIIKLRTTLGLPS